MGRGVGTLIDYSTTLQLRTYAFTSLYWAASDFACVAQSPTRSPRQLFEFPSSHRFLQLSFGLVRLDSEGQTLYIHPFLLNQLREDTRTANPLCQRRLLVLQGPNDIKQRSAGGLPVYAIPASIVDHAANALRPLKNRSRWRPLELKSSRHVHVYRFPSVSALVTHLVSALNEVELSSSSALTLCGEEIQLTPRGELYEEINPGYERHLDPRSAVVMS